MRSVKAKLLAALSLLFFAHCHAPVRPVTGEAHPVVVIAPGSLQPGQFGPFHTGMTSREAAALCLPPGEVEKAVAEVPDALDHAQGTNFRCILLIGTEWYHAYVYAEAQKLRELRVLGVTPFAGKKPTTALLNAMTVELESYRANEFPKSLSEKRQRLDRLLSLMVSLRPGATFQLTSYFDGWDSAVPVLALSAEGVLALKRERKQTSLLLEYINFPDVYADTEPNPWLYIKFDGERRREWETWKRKQAHVVRLDPARDIQADRVGPFVHGMSIEEAAKLCGKELTDEERKRTTTDVTGRTEPKSELLLHEALIGSQTFQLELFFMAGKLEKMELEIKSDVAKSLDPMERTAWLNGATALLGVLVQAGAGRGLQIGDYYALGRGESVTPWRNKNPPTAEVLLSYFAKQPKDSDGVDNAIGVAWMGSSYPLLHLATNGMWLEFKFSNSKKKEPENQRPPAEPSKTQQAVAMPFPELAGLPLGASKAEVAAWLKKKKILRCIGLSKQEAADPKASIECPAVRFAGGNSVAWFGFEQGRLSAVRLYVQPSVQPLTSWKAAKPHALRLFKHLQQHVGPVVFRLGGPGEISEKYADQVATAEAVSSELVGPGTLAEFSLFPRKRNAGYEVYGGLWRHQSMGLLSPRFEFYIYIYGNDSH